MNEATHRHFFFRTILADMYMRVCVCVCVFSKHTYLTVFYHSVHGIFWQNVNAACSTVRLVGYLPGGNQTISLPWYFFVFFFFFDLFRLSSLHRSTLWEGNPAWRRSCTHRCALTCIYTHTHTHISSSLESCRSNSSCATLHFSFIFFNSFFFFLFACWSISTNIIWTHLCLFVLLLL